MRVAFITALTTAVPLISQSVDEVFLRISAPTEIMVACVEKARAINAKDSRLLAEYGHAYLAAGQQEKGIGCFNSALANDSRDGETHRLISHAWFMLGKREAAISALAPLTKPNMKYMVGYRRGAMDLLVHLGSAEADAMMETAYLKDPKDDFVFRTFGNFCVPDHPQLAAKWLLRGFHKEEVKVLLKAALRLMKAGHGAAAETVMDRYLKAEPDSPEDCMEFAKLALAHKEGALVAKFCALAKARILPTESAWTRAKISKSANDLVDIGALRLLQGDREGAEAAFVLALPKVPKDPDLYAAIARGWFAAGFKAEGIKALEPLNSPAIKNSGAFYDAAFAYLSEGMIQEADRFMSHFHSLEPREWEDRIAFGEAALDAGFTDLAVKWLTKPGAERKAKENLGVAAIRLMDSGHPEAAANVMEVAYGLDPRDWPNSCEFGRACVRNGNRELAAKYFYRAINLNPLSERMWNEVALAFAENGKGIRNTFLID
ncbi:MAG: hypothetical protein HYZ13_11365 [Acidobacteria bacterium]|nr:hypothetical protein [Acidobacteriota bacterium]